MKIIDYKKKRESTADWCDVASKALLNVAIDAPEESY